MHIFGRVIGKKIISRDWEALYKAKLWKILMPF